MKSFFLLIYFLFLATATFADVKIFVDVNKILFVLDEYKKVFETQSNNWILDDSTITEVTFDSVNIIVRSFDLSNLYEKIWKLDNIFNKADDYFGSPFTLLNLINRPDFYTVYIYVNDSINAGVYELRLKGNPQLRLVYKTDPSAGKFWVTRDYFYELDGWGRLFVLNKANLTEKKLFKDVMDYRLLKDDIIFITKKDTSYVYSASTNNLLKIDKQIHFPDQHNINKIDSKYLCYSILESDDSFIGLKFYYYDLTSNSLKNITDEEFKKKKSIGLDLESCTITNDKQIIIYIKYYYNNPYGIPEYLYEYDCFSRAIDSSTQDFTSIVMKLPILFRIY